MYGCHRLLSRTRAVVDLFHLFADPGGAERGNRVEARPRRRVPCADWASGPHVPVCVRRLRHPARHDGPRCDRVRVLRLLVAGPPRRHGAGAAGAVRVHGELCWLRVGACVQDLQRRGLEAQHAHHQPVLPGMAVAPSVCVCVCVRMYACTNVLAVLFRPRSVRSCSS